jgi:Carbohydrate-selective porin, OprB family/S-layer homology domain
MTKLSCKFLKLSPVIFAATFFAANSALASEVNQPMTSVAQLSQESQSLGQVTSVSQFSDVQPTDWAFQALQSLVERYGCIAGYPNGTYRGNRALTRYEFAAGLNACLDRVNELVATATADLVTKEDLATLQRLQEEFSAELATLRGRVDTLEARTAELEANQFSTTTKLTGEAIFNVADVFGDERAFPYGFSRDDFNGVNLANQTAAVNRIAALTGFNTAQAVTLFLLTGYV